MISWIALAQTVAMGVATAAVFAVGRNSGAAAEAAKAREADNQSLKEAADAQGRMLEAGRCRSS